MPPAKKKRKRKTPQYLAIPINGWDSTSPRQVTLKKKDRICWVDPNGSGPWYVSFTATSPLKGLKKSGEVKVLKGGASAWHQLKKVSKGSTYFYMVRSKRKGVGPAPGPEIIAGD